MNPTDLKRLFPNASADTIARNAHIFDVRPLAAHQPKPHPGQTLERDPQKEAVGAGSVARRHIGPGIRWRVALVAFVGRRLDRGDNLAAGFKPLQDVVAKDLGIDDGDDRIEWEYGQHETRGPEQTLVLITEEHQ